WSRHGSELSPWRHVSAQAGVQISGKIERSLLSSASVNRRTAVLLSSTLILFLPTAHNLFGPFLMSTRHCHHCVSSCVRILAYAAPPDRRRGLPLADQSFRRKI